MLQAFLDTPLPSEPEQPPDDGRYVAFQWYDGFTRSDIFLADRVTGAMERISVDSNEKAGDSYSYVPHFTPDLRYVAFSSWSTTWSPGCPACPAEQKNPGPGTTVQIQLWYRDPLSTSNQTSSLSNGLQVEVCP